MSIAVGESDAVQADRVLSRGNIVVREVGAGLEAGAAALAYDKCLFAHGKTGQLAECRISELRDRQYELLILGSALSTAGFEGCAITITRASDGTVLHCESLQSCYRSEAGTCFSIIFDNRNSHGDINILISLSAEAHFRIDAINIIDADYLSDFAILNKSYLKDLPWTVVLYRSWVRFSQVDCPFYVVVPARDLAVFVEAFRAELAGCRISRMPNIVTEEWVFSVGNIIIPGHFSGWQTQQIVKLGFSKTRIARQYLTVDSTMIFTKPFDFRLLLKSGSIYTAANPTNRGVFFEYFRRVDEKGWLNGKLVNISESFDAICNFFENYSNETNAYISCTGLFNSNLTHELEVYTRSKGIDGFVGLIQIAPYEFAWYGEFVFSQRRSQFVPHDPHLMTLGHSEEHARALSDGLMQSEGRHMGIMLQPPASELCDPELIFAMVQGGELR